MKLKKVLAVMLGLGLALGSAGCGKQAAQTAAAPAAETKAETAAETKAETAAETKAETAAETKAETAAETKAETKAAADTVKAVKGTEAAKTEKAASLSGKTVEMDFPYMGMTLTFPEEIEELKGGYVLQGGEEAGYRTGLFLLQFYYVGMSEEEWENADEDAQMNALVSLPVILSINGDRGRADIESMLDMTLSEDELKEFKKNEDMTYCLYTAEAPAPKIGEEYQKELEQVRKWYSDAIENAEFYPAVEMEYPTYAGETFDAETEDLDGNAVKLKDVFAKHEITMVNFWGSFCPPCKAELPELAELDPELQKKDCGIIGILVDSEIEGRIDDAKAVLKDSKVKYPSYRCVESIDTKYCENGIPSTIFVDRNGKIVGEVVVGVPDSDNVKAGYMNIIDSLLEGKTAETEMVPADADQKVSQDKKVGSYDVIVKDADGKPVKDVMVQFCSDSQCMFGVTDAEGKASFMTGPGTYQVHILKAPEGYAKHTEVYEVTDSGKDLEIVLEKE